MANGFHGAMDHAGAVIGPLLAMAILALSSNNFRLVFFLAVNLALLAAGLILLVRVPRNEIKSA